MNDPVAFRPLFCEGCGSEHITDSTMEPGKRRCRSCGHVFPYGDHRTDTAMQG